MTTLADFNGWVQDCTQDSDEILSSADRDKAVAQGLAQYAKHRPRVLVVDVAGDGGYDYDLPATWSDGFSTLRSVEYPAGERDPEYLEAEDYTLYTSPSATQLRFLTVTPQSGQSARLTFTAPHTVSTTTSTIPTADEAALADLAAAVACEWLSSHFSQQGAPTLTADTADHSSKARDFALRASAFRKQAYSHLGIATGKDGASTSGAGVAAASAMADWDLNLSTGHDRLTHPRRYR